MLRRAGWRAWAAAVSAAGVCARAPAAPVDNGTSESARLNDAPGTFAYQPPGTPDSGAGTPTSPPPDAAQPGADSQTPSPLPVRAKYGQSGTRWWTVGGAASYGFNGSTDLGAFGEFSYFVASDVEVGTELALWHFNQTGDDASGLSGSLLFRWHFIDSGPWTVFADAGIGVLGSTDNVPEGGTSFNFMPRLGIGFTRQLTDSGLRLQAGWRWHHISNARIHGDENNPARDQNLIYAALVFPF